MAVNALDVFINCPFDVFQVALRDICLARRLALDELTFADFNEIFTEYVAALT